MKNSSNKRFEEEEINILLLFFDLVIMLVSFVAIKLFFNHVLGIYWDYFISGYWVLSIIPLIFYFLYLQKKKRVSFREIGLRTDHIPKSIAFGAAAGVIAGLAGWVFLHLWGSPASPVPGELTLLFLFTSVLSAPIREEFIFRRIFWAVIERTATLYSKKKNVELDPGKKDIVIIVLVSLAFLSVHMGREPDRDSIHQDTV